MKFEVINKKLVKAVKCLKEVIADYDSPFQGRLLIEPYDSENVEITALADRMIASLKVPATVDYTAEYPEAIVVDAARLMAGIENADGISKIITLKNSVEVFGENYSLRLKKYETDDFIKLVASFGVFADGDKEVDSVYIGRFTLREMFRKSFYAVDLKNKDKRLIRYLAIQADKERQILRLVGTDAKRLALCEHEVEVKRGFELLASGMLVKSVKLMSEYDFSCDSDLILSRHGGHGLIWPENAEWTLRFTLPFGEFPSFKKIIPEYDSCLDSFEIDRADLIKALMITSDFEGSADEAVFGVRFELNGDWSRANVKIIEDGEIVADAKVRCTPKKKTTEGTISFTCRAKFILELARSFEDDELTLQWFGKGKIIRFNSTIPAFALVMPLNDNRVQTKTEEE